MDNGKPFREMNNYERELYEIDFRAKEERRIEEFEKQERKKRIRKICKYKIKKRIKRLYPL
jgi:hypothetical protein